MRGRGAALEEVADGANAVAEVIAAAAKAMVARERVMMKVYVEGMTANDTSSAGSGWSARNSMLLKQVGRGRARACCCETCDVCVSF